jgi:hypothetical protein
MTLTESKDSIVDVISKTMEENYQFFMSNPAMKEIIDEIVELANDAIDYIPKTTEISSEQIFSFHGFTPLSYGIFVSLLSGNIATCFTQLRTLIEFYAMVVLAKKKFPKDESLEQLKKIKKLYRWKTSKMIQEFDPKAHQLWKNLSTWSHGITYSQKAIRSVIKGQVSHYHIIQPAIYDKKDFDQLLELKLQIRTLRNIIKNNE